MFEILVTTSLGLDELLLQELKHICPDVQAKNRPGQLRFSGSLSDAYKICLWSRLANRVLIKLGEGPVDHGDDVYNIASRINWTQHFSTDHTFAIDFNGTNKAVNNTQFGAVRIKDAIVDQFNELYDSRPTVDKLNPDIRFQGRLKRNVLEIYFDIGGNSLHQRHYRQDTGPAPIKEHVAAGMLMRSGWAQDMDKPLVDPMCGSGTIAIEAAMMAANIAPGLKRDSWGFDNWSGHDQRLWQSLCEHARGSQKDVSTPIFANDIDRTVVNIAKQNADTAGVFSAIQFSSQDVAKFKVNAQWCEGQPGFIVCNPPYGERLGELTQLLPMFRAWGRSLKQNFGDWKVSLLTTNRDLLRQLKLVASKEYKMMNGNLECQLVNYVLDEKNCTVRSDDTENDFANRLRKNLKRLNKWLKQENTNAYRIYDADLPEYNVAIDRYDDWLVVQEYAPPKDVPEQKATRRLHDVILALPEVTQVKPENIVVKVRMKQKGTSQYQKVAAQKQFMTVFENGALFQVNLKDYLDTGLFLDHRITRQIVRDMASGKDVLNLFSYTGSVSVHAALGGARSVTTVDMSRTYLEWAKQNFTLNKLKGAYQFIQADCLEWLASHDGKYDLIFIDPPSFSNSKRMDATWDVQRDHVALLTDAVKCLKPSGTIIFSNNFRPFKLDEPAVKELGLSIENISAQTLPEDFKRNPKIHHCWKLTR